MDSFVAEFCSQQKMLSPSREEALLLGTGRAFAGTWMVQNCFSASTTLLFGCLRLANAQPLRRGLRAGQRPAAHNAGGTPSLHLTTPGFGVIIIHDLYITYIRMKLIKRKVRTYSATDREVQMLDAIAGYHGWNKSRMITGLIRKEFWRIFPAGTDQIRPLKGARVEEK